MEGKERYKYYAETNQLYNSEEDELYAYNLNNNKIISILNQQDKRIKELETEIEKYKLDELADAVADLGMPKLSKHELWQSIEQQYSKNMALEEALKKANTNNYLTDYYLVEKENQQLKQQLSDEEKAHDLCIDHFNEECEKMRKQIKFESEARERFKQENQQLKQSQKQLAIEELQKLKAELVNKVIPVNLSYTGYVQEVFNKLNNQIKSLKGE